MEDSIFEDSDTPIFPNEVFTKLEQYKKDLSKITDANQYKSFILDYSNYTKTLKDNAYIFEIPIVQAIINEIDGQIIALEKTIRGVINHTTVLSKLEQYNEEFQKITDSKIFTNTNKQTYEDIKIDYIDFQIYLHNYRFGLDEPQIQMLISQIDEKIIFLENKFLGQFIEEEKMLEEDTINVSDVQIKRVVPLNIPHKDEPLNIEIIKKVNGYCSFVLPSNKMTTVYTGPYTNTDISNILRNHQYY